MPRAHSRLQRLAIASVQDGFRLNACVGVQLNGCLRLDPIGQCRGVWSKEGMGAGPIGGWESPQWRGDATSRGAHAGHPFAPVPIIRRLVSERSASDDIGSLRICNFSTSSLYEIVLTGKIPDVAADKPASGVAWVERQCPIDQPNHGAHILDHCSARSRPYDRRGALLVPLIPGEFDPLLRHLIFNETRLLLGCRLFLLFLVFDEVGEQLQLVCISLPLLGCRLLLLFLVFDKVGEQFQLFCIFARLCRSEHRLFVVDIVGLFPLLGRREPGPP